MKFRITAGTNVGLRDNNEDNFVVSANLATGKWTIPQDTSQVFELDILGSLMAVADGMGGQKAGEVASAIAIETIQQMFAKEVIDPDVIKSPKSIKNYLRRVIIEADKRIKAHTKKDPSTISMGSTLVMAWFVNDVVYIAWIGDSRAYSIMPGKGIGRLSKDHSFVQQLVDSGKITELQALTHPDNNVITKSLGDTSKSANPDVVEHKLVKGETILLCSDGLCGSVEDAVIGDIVESNVNNLNDCKAKLITTALEHGSSDNITIALCAIDDHPNTTPLKEDHNKSKKPNTQLWITGSIVALACIIAFLIVFNDNKSDEALETEIEQKEIINNPGDTFAAPKKTDEKAEKAEKGEKADTANIDESDVHTSVSEITIPSASQEIKVNGDTNITVVKSKPDSITLSNAKNSKIKLN